MNKKQLYFLILLLVLAVLSGYLLSHASLVGKAGMTYVHKEYAFLKTWWKGALTVLALWLLLWGIQTAVQRKVADGTARLIHIASIVVALSGLYFTYYDFRHTLSHRLLGERFHLGGYLFWAGWLLISGYMLVNNRPAAQANNPSKTPVV